MSAAFLARVSQARAGVSPRGVGAAFLFVVCIVAALLPPLSARDLRGGGLASRTRVRASSLKARCPQWRETARFLARGTPRSRVWARTASVPRRAVRSARAAAEPAAVAPAFAPTATVRAAVPRAAAAAARGGDAPVAATRAPGSGAIGASPSPPARSRPVLPATAPPPRPPAAAVGAGGGAGGRPAAAARPGLASVLAAAAEGGAAVAQVASGGAGAEGRFGFRPPGRPAAIAASPIVMAPAAAGGGDRDGGGYDSAGSDGSDEYLRALDGPPGGGAYDDIDGGGVAAAAGEGDGGDSEGAGGGGGGYAARQASWAEPAPARPAAATSSKPAAPAAPRRAAGGGAPPPIRRGRDHRVGGAARPDSGAFRAMPHQKVGMDAAHVEVAASRRGESFFAVVSGGGGSFVRLTAPRWCQQRGPVNQDALVKNAQDQLYFSKKARAVEYKCAPGPRGAGRGVGGGGRLLTWRGRPGTLAEYKAEKPTTYVELGMLGTDLQDEALVAKVRSAAREVLGRGGGKRACVCGAARKQDARQRIWEAAPRGERDVHGD